MARRISYSFSIPEPCSQGWQNMTATEKGKFCQACQKEVIDFTQMRDEEIVQVFKTSGGTVCGHISKNRLNREICITEYTWKFPFRVDLVAGLLALAVIQPLVTHASISPNKSGYVIAFPCSGDENKLPQTRGLQDSIYQIKGKVLDAKSRTPLAFTNITVAGMPQTGVVADSNGVFTIALPFSELQEVKLDFLLVGYEPYSYTVTEKELRAGQPLVVYLEEQEWLLDGVMIMVPEPKDRTGKRQRK